MPLFVPLEYMAPPLELPRAYLNTMYVYESKGNSNECIRSEGRERIKGEVEGRKKGKEGWEGREDQFYLVLLECM